MISHFSDECELQLLLPQLLCLHDFSLELLLQLFLDLDLDFFFFGVQDLFLLLYFRLEPEPSISAKKSGAGVVSAETFLLAE